MYIQKVNLIYHFFYDRLCNLMAESILACYLRSRILSDKRYNMIFQFRSFPGKTNDKTFQKMQRTPFCPFFWAKQKFLHILFLPVFVILAKHHCARFNKKYSAHSKRHWFQVHKHKFMVLFQLKPGVKKCVFQLF